MTGLLGEPSPKQIRSFADSDAHINIWVGAVRSGKTYISIWRFIDFVSRGPEGEYVMIAKTYRSFREYIVPQINQIIGADYEYRKGNQEITLYGKKIHLIGANDERAEGKIRGATFAGAYVDEMTIIPESVFRMLISRCAMHGAKIFATTNPDSPFHWVKRDFLDGNPDVKQWHFTLDDNPNLSDNSKEYLKRQYVGLWYQRFIEGKWVQAENSIYDQFDEKYHVIESPPSWNAEYIVGIDYGTTNPCAFVLIGHDPLQNPNLWVENEYYFDSKAKQRQKTDAEYADDLKRFIEGKNIRHIYLDPSAVSFRIELQKRGLRPLIEANNDVLDGIRFVSNYLVMGKLKVCAHCKNILKEFQSYVWDEKSQKVGIDKPKKENDHCFVAGTLISTMDGPRVIENIKKGDSVKTRSGYKKVLETFCNTSEVSIYNVLGKEITATDSHPFLTVSGWKNLSDLIQSDILFIEGDKCPNASYLMESNIDVIQTLKTLAIETILDVTNPLLLKDLDIFIETYGNITLEKYHPDTIFITKTGIPQTTLLAISNAFVAASISPLICKIFQKTKETNSENMQQEYDRLQKNGMGVNKGTSGIKSMLKTLAASLKEKRSVLNAKRHSLRQKPPLQNFVRISVKLNSEENLILIMSKENAIFAEKNSSLINMQKRNSVLSLVQKKNIGNQKVYNIHVEEENEYYAEGILVHNCLDALRYAIYTHFKEKRGEGLSPAQLDANFHKALGIEPNVPRFFRNDDFRIY